MVPHRQFFLTQSTYATGCSLNIVFFRTFRNIFWTLVPCAKRVCAGLYAAKPSSSIFAAWPTRQLAEIGHLDLRQRSEKTQHFKGKKLNISWKSTCLPDVASCLPSGKISQNILSRLHCKMEGKGLKEGWWKRVSDYMTSQGRWEREEGIVFDGRICTYLIIWFIENHIQVCFCPRLSISLIL